MADKGFRKLNPKEVQEHMESGTPDKLRDAEGNFYEVSEEHYKKQMRIREDTPDHQQDLELARELLNSNLRQLTPRQQDVMYYKMQDWSEAKIAKKLGITQTTVSEHLIAAKKELAALIKSTKEVMNNGNWNSDAEDIRD